MATTTATMAAIGTTDRDYLDDDGGDYLEPETNGGGDYLEPDSDGDYLEPDSNGGGDYLEPDSNGGGDYLEPDSDYLDPLPEEKEVVELGVRFGLPPVTPLHEPPKSNIKKAHEVLTGLRRLTIIEEPTEVEEEIAEKLHEALKAEGKVHDRRFRMKSYRQCFVASEAVDYMVQNEMAEDREEAVQLGRLMETKMELWHHVCDDHAFEDDFLFFRFTADDPDNEEEEGAPKERPKNTRERRSKRESRGGTLRKIKEAPSRLTSSAGKLVKKSGKSALKITKEVTHNASHPKALGKSAIKLTKEVTHQATHKANMVTHHVTKPLRGKSAPDMKALAFNQKFRDEQLKKIAAHLEMSLDIQDRSYRLKTYKQCFVACEAVDLMLENNLVDSRDEAVRVGRLLQTKLNLWHHVTNDHDFEDQYWFFKSTSGIQHDDEKLKHFAVRLRQLITVKDHTHLFKTHKLCFAASDAVSVMVKSAMAESRQDAVWLARLLQKKKNLWYPVGGDDFKFKDDHTLFRFTEDAEKASRVSR